MRKPWGIFIFFLVVISGGLLWLVALNGWRFESLFELAGKKRDNAGFHAKDSVDFSGTYIVSSGDSSRDTLTIRRVGKGYNLCWRDASGQTYYGNGLEKQGLLAAVYEMALPKGRRAGVAVYTKKGNSLSGLKVGSGDDKFTLEGTDGAAGLTPSATRLGGTWKLEGTNPNGSAYKGVLKLDHTGPTYAVEWQIEDPPLFGTGFSVDDILIAGYGTSMGLGLVVYTISEGELTGTWLYSDFSRLAGTSDIRTGKEIATK
ncbi:hypothetical protein GX441_12750 [bacterium]|nr:hypothetical protein [bacterium]